MKGKKNYVSLIGASASGSLAFNCLIAFPNDVLTAVDLCGRLKVGDEQGFRSFKQRAEGTLSFAQSVRRFEANTSKLSPKLKQRMLITKGWWDELVPEKTMEVEGIRSVRVPFVEHGINISLSVSSFFIGKTVLEFIKTQ